MPGLFSDAYQYYQYNLQSGSGVFDELLPLLIYSVFTTVSYILLVAFITHFVIRAFWVGFIGLMSVYKEGIKYDNLPYSDLYKEEARKKLGSSERMAMRLDQISSLIFSIAFVVVLMMVAVAILYFIFFLFYNVLKLFLGPEIFETYADVLYYAFLVFIFGYIAAIYILNLKRFRSNPRLARWHFNLSWNLNAVIMPVVYKPLQFIQLTFLSNMSTTRFMSYYAVLFVLFFGVLMGVMLTTLDAAIFDARNFYTTKAEVHRFNLEDYSDNIRDKELLHAASIDKPLVESAFLPVFIPYPKLLDEKINRFCNEISISDSLKNFEKRRQKNKHYIDCATNFFSFTIDDSLILDPGLSFGAHPRTRQQGYRTYLNIENLTSGKHILHVERKAVDKADSTRLEEGRALIFENEIPFWKE